MNKESGTRQPDHQAIPSGGTGSCLQSMHQMGTLRPSLALSLQVKSDHCSHFIVLGGCFLFSSNFSHNGGSLLKKEKKKSKIKHDTMETGTRQITVHVSLQKPILIL